MDEIIFHKRFFCDFAFPLLLKQMERLNGEIRDREKVMRGLKKDDTPILKGYQIFHNYIRPNEGLNVRHQQKLAELKLKEKTSG